MRVSAIEIGTNSTKFIIAELTEKGSFKVLKRTSTVNRLSSGMYSENNLTPLAIEKEFEIIGNLIDESKKQEAKLLSVFSTSVLRDAANKHVFLDRVKKEYGIDINVISGEKEAHLAYMACKEIADKNMAEFAVIDIGGGSTEIIIGNGNNMDQKLSLNVGAVRLTEMFVRHDPVSESELEQIAVHIEKQIDEMGLSDLSGLQLIGTGGTIKSLGTISIDQDYSNESIVNGKVIKRLEIERLFDRLKLLSIEEKKKLTGLNPKRADVITAGIYILLTIMKRFNIDQIKISTQGVLEGFVAEYIQTLQQ